MDGDPAQADLRRARLDHEFDRTWNELTAPGALFEVESIPVRGQELRHYVNAPADARAMWADAANWGSRTYLVYRDERVSYARAWEITASVAAWLKAQGVRRGDRVAIAMRNYPEWLLIYWACLSIGAAAVGINAWWIADEIAFALTDSAPKVVFCDAERLERVTACGDAARDVVVVAVRAEAVGNQIAWATVLATPAVMPLAVLDPDDDASILYTSGTTGVPKGAQLTHRGQINTLMNIAFATEVHAVAERRARALDAPSPGVAVALVTTPLFHVTALGLAYAITAGGGTLVLMHKWDAGEALRLIEAERVTNLSGVPTIGRELVQHPRLLDHDVSSLGAIVGGGAPMPPDLIDKIERVDLPVRPHTGFGMTEASGAIAAAAGDYLVAKPASCGRILPTFEHRIVDDEGRPCPPLSTGELCIRGCGVIKGYINRPEATADAIRDGWLHTGDIAWIDPAGFLHVVDRKKDMILRGGENVYCAEVEAALLHHPAVIDACAFGVADERLGEEVGAAIQVREGATLTGMELRSDAHERLAKYKVPRYLWLLSSPFPRNAAGKALRRELRATLPVDEAV
ncbi:class I adenylate-forming enzyme family protein [Sphingomonas bacterium]|uniref:class I adenylate-forming enzyme family protein n=1 Tax=Sphingomonas bacterium TaxID=1895847 RepID=UPI0015762CF9|nr:class I adenylate-forming enzyme family protein [Sphingomonas bacterium]